MKGLCCYFDKALPVMLLYNNERQQYQEACPNDIVPSAIYGAEHLLRLFGMLISPSQTRWLDHLELHIYCFASESKNKSFKISVFWHVTTFDLVVALALCYGYTDSGRVVLQNAGHWDQPHIWVYCYEFIVLLSLQLCILNFALS